MLKRFINSFTKTALAFLITANLAVFATGSADLNLASDSANLGTSSASQDISPSATISSEVASTSAGIQPVSLDDASLYIDREEAKRINKDNTGKFVSDEIQVDFKEGLTDKDKEKLLRDYKLKIARDKIDPNSKVIKVLASKRDEIIELLKKDPNIKGVRKNGIVKTAIWGMGGSDCCGNGGVGPAPTPPPNEPNDPLYPFQQNLQKISMKDAWTWTKGSSSIYVAVIDSGVDYNHPELAGKVVKGKDFVDGGMDPMDDIPEGHGTAVAGVIGAKTNNGQEMAAVNWNASIYALRVINENSEGTNDRLEDAIRYTENFSNVKVVNLSLVNFGWDGGVFAAMSRMTPTKTFVVSSSYNPGWEPWCSIDYPAGYENVIAVNGTDNNDDEKTGCGQATTYNNFIVSAPGFNIQSLNKSSGSSQRNGTSVAAPQVSAIAAMIWGCTSTYLSDQQRNQIVKDSIRNGLDPVDPDGNWGRLSLGRINARKALDYYCY